MKIINNNITFGTNRRTYKNSDGITIRTTTNPFREDVNWKQLAEYEKILFQDKKKVNVVQFAASDGSEAYTKIITLLESQAGDKFFPIEAYDIDPEIVKAANSGKLNLYKVDRLSLQDKVPNPKKYFSKSKDSLEIQNNVTIPTGNTITVKAKNILRKRVNFAEGDMFKIIKNLKDESNTILLCRNILGYFDDKKISEFVKNAANKLKQGSLFIIGSYDTKHSSINSILIKNNFLEVTKNVFRKL